LKDFGLNAVPAEVCKLSNLKTLILSNNPLKTIPLEIGELKSLQILQLSSCDLFDESIPAEVWKGLTLLEEINLSNNGLTNMEPLMDLVGLKRVNLSNNELLKIPVSVN